MYPSPSMSQHSQLAHLVRIIVTSIFHNFSMLYDVVHTVTSPLSCHCKFRHDAFPACMKHRGRRKSARPLDFACNVVPKVALYHDLHRELLRIHNDMSQVSQNGQLVPKHLTEMEQFEGKSNMGMLQDRKCLWIHLSAINNQGAGLLDAGNCTFGKIARSWCLNFNPASSQMSKKVMSQ